jgi:hypothetical protein
VFFAYPQTKKLFFNKHTKVYHSSCISLYVSWNREEENRFVFIRTKSV